MDINITNAVGQCTEFKGAVGAKKEMVSVIISPLKVTAEDDAHIKIINGCNLWQGCFNKACQFSIAARKIPKIKEAGS
ncbi:MAG: hypothetical protein ABSF21_00295 [Dehalococcoidia bacterium]